VKTLKLKVLTILGLVAFTALVATTFAVYSYATPTRIRAVDEEYGEMPGGHDEMRNHWEEMHGECTEMMNEIHGEEHNSTMHSETEEPHHHHGCH
jgi:hypothetical protein